MIALLTQLALAADLPTVALVPLDATPDTSTADLHVMIRGIAAAIQSEGGVVPVYDDDLALRLGDKSEDRLKDAREALSEGRQSLAEGDADIALPFLQEAVTAHADAGSEVVRREESADAHYTLARAYLATYDRNDAAAEIRQAIQLVPDYLTTRADALTDDLIALGQEAKASLASRPPRHLTAQGAADLATGFGVDDIVHGTVDADGNLTLNVQQGTTTLYTVVRPGPFKPPPVGNAFYTAIAGQIVAACLGEPIPEWHAPPPTPPTNPVVPPPNLVTPVPPPIVPHHGKATAAIWTITGVLAAGAGAAVWYALPAPPPPASTWSLTVQHP